MSSLKTKIKNVLIYGIAPIADLTRRKKPRTRVVALHDVPEKWRDDFQKKMQWLKTNFNMVSLESVYSGAGLDNNRLNIALTFDDGFKEHATFVAPVLRNLSIPTTFFVPSGVFNDMEKFGQENLKRHGVFEFMNHQEIKTLAQDPLFNIGGHTTHHTNLGQQLSPEELENEIVQDKKNLENITGKPIDFFAYPSGNVKNIHVNSMSVIKNAKYKAAFTIVPSFWSSGGNCYRAGRDSLSLNESVQLWNACFRGGYDTVSQLKNFLFNNL